MSHQRSKSVDTKFKNTFVRLDRSTVEGRELHLSIFKAKTSKRTSYNEGDISLLGCFVIVIILWVVMTHFLNA